MVFRKQFPYMNLVLTEVWSVCFTLDIFKVICQRLQPQFYCQRDSLPLVTKTDMDMKWNWQMVHSCPNWSDIFLSKRNSFIVFPIAKEKQMLQVQIFARFHAVQPVAPSVPYVNSAMYQSKKEIPFHRVQQHDWMGQHIMQFNAQDVNTRSWCLHSATVCCASCISTNETKGWMTRTIHYCWYA